MVADYDVVKFATSKACFVSDVNLAVSIVVPCKPVFGSFKRHLKSHLIAQLISN